MRRATIRTEPADADAIAAALAPDNTPEMSTQVEDGTVVTTIERETTGGLQSTIDDYVVNLSVAEQVVQTANRSDQTNHE
ncbi:KEOPS complex subunit Pcc1 [Halomicrococcus gelatinilyticus]|uniref:KEOPS complex subunit Pcc1 n=1 Tax=Halomicrococcus gelatinilyticus TaxID=1702103 RepID=UPI002E10377F